MRKKILLTGSNGNLAKEILLVLFEHETIGCDIHLENKNNVNHYFKVDFRSDPEIEKFHQNLIAKNLAPDIIINNAAVDSVPSIESKNKGWNKDKFFEYFQVNVKAPAVLFSLFTDYWTKNNIKAQIINFTSIYNKVSPDPKLYRTGFIKDVNYGASKAAFVNIFKQFAVIHSNSNQSININFIELGGVESSLQDEEFKNNYLNRIPDSSFVKKENVSKAISFLITLNNEGINGLTISIDSGYTLI